MSDFHPAPVMSTVDAQCRKWHGGLERNQMSNLTDVNDRVWVENGCH